MTSQPAPQDLPTARRRAVVERPEGLVYAPGLLDVDDEARMVEFLEDLPYHEVRMRGQTAKRTVIHFGFDYDYSGWKIMPTEPVPPTLADLHRRLAELAGVSPDDLVQCLVARYPPGAGIGWHRDAPMFGSPVVGASLGSGCTMRFQRRIGQTRQTYALLLEPRSGYVLSGAARASWQHSIPATRALRYSVTFRTIPNPARWLPDEARPVGRD